MSFSGCSHCWVHFHFEIAYKIVNVVEFCQEFIAAIKMSLDITYNVGKHCRMSPNFWKSCLNCQNSQQTYLSLDTTLPKHKNYRTGPSAFSNSGRQTKPVRFWTFWPISQDSVHTFQNQFLHWNRGFKPVILSTINPINWTNFFLVVKGRLEF